MKKGIKRFIWIMVLGLTPFLAMQVLAAQGGTATGGQSVTGGAGSEKSGMELQKMAQWAGVREHWRRVPPTLGGKIYLWEHYIISHRDVLDLTLQQLNDIGARLNDQRRNWIGKRADETILFMEIEDLLLKEPMDLKKVEEKVKAIQALSGEMFMEEIRTPEKVLSLLTPEQRSMVREFMRESTFTRRIGDY
jgi:Spy/CpxP family protein refolding chaperone